MTSVLLGIDVGTNSVKAVLYDLDGGEIAVASRSYPLLTPRPGWVEQDTEEVWQATLETITEIVAKSEEYDIKGLSIAAQAGSIIPCNEEGNPVYPMITWLDQRSTDIVARWQTENLLHPIRQISGWSPFPGLPLPSIVWLKENLPAVHARAKRYLGPADFCIHRLTDTFATDYSAAAEMVLVDLHTEDWSETLCQMAGVQAEMQSELGWAGRQVGMITERIERLTGLPAGTPVIAGGHDQCCACVGMGMLDPGGIMLSTGTAWVITAIADSPDLTAIPEHMNLNFHAAPQRWAPSQYLGGFGATVEWWLNQSWQSPDPAQPLARSHLFHLFDSALEDSVPGSHDLIFLPLDSPARGAFLGLTLAHTRTDMSRAILEGAALEVKLALKELQASGTPVNELWIAGGAATSPIWPQILADITGIPIILAAYPSWAALGAAALAGWGVGAFPSLEDAVTRLQPPVRRLDPNPKLTKIYDDIFERYQNLKGINHEL